MKKVLLILIPILLIGGGVVAAGFLGVINIPGLTPIKKGLAMYGENGDKAPDLKVDKSKSQPATPPAPLKVATKGNKPPAKVTIPTTDPVKGAKKLASVWGAMETPKLAEIVKDWKDPELALILANMDPSKVAELLATIDDKRASKLSRELQTVAALKKGP